MPLVTKVIEELDYADDLIALDLKRSDVFREHDFFAAGRDDAQAHCRQVKIAGRISSWRISSKIWIQRVFNLLLYKALNAWGFTQIIHKPYFDPLKGELGEGGV